MIYRSEKEVKHMRKILRKCKVMLSAIMMISCIVGLTGCEPVTMNLMTSSIQTEISECECAIIAMPTTTETITDSSIGYSYGYGIQSDGKFGFGYGLVPKTKQKEITEYCIVAKYNENYYCRFQLDELDWKMYHIGDSITLQVVQKYNSYGGTYPPYVAYNGRKLKDYEKLSENEAKAVEKEYDKIMEGDRKNDIGEL